MVLHYLSLPGDLPRSNKLTAAICGGQHEDSPKAGIAERPLPNDYMESHMTQLTLYSQNPVDCEALGRLRSGLVEVKPESTEGVALQQPNGR